MATTHPPETNLGTVTSWLPVTTAFPSIPGCGYAVSSTANAWGPVSDWGPPSGVWASDWSSGWGPSTSTVQCLPAAVTTWAIQPVKSSTFYSLGPFVCPEAYSTTSEIVVGSTTHFTCCPPGYTCANGLATSPVSATFVQGLAIDAYQFGSLTSTSTPSPRTTDSLPKTSVGISIVFIGSTPFSSTTNSSLQTSVATPSASTSSPPFSGTTNFSPQTSVATPSASTSSSSDLSTGSKVAIGVSIPLAVIGILALIAATFTVKRRKKRDDGSQAYSSGYPAQSQPETFQKVLHVGDLCELSGTNNNSPFELIAGHGVSELQDGHAVYWERNM